MKRGRKRILRVRDIACIMLLFYTYYGYSVGGIEILTNTTNTSVSNPAQQSPVSVEAVFYNPAGSAFLDEGHYFHYGV